MSHYKRKEKGLKAAKYSKRKKNLCKKVPTCNSCNKPMEKKSGRRGDFYFCTNKCKEQPTVSDYYWQSVRRMK